MTITNGFLKYLFFLFNTINGDLFSRKSRGFSFFQRIYCKERKKESMQLQRRCQAHRFGLCYWQLAPIHPPSDQSFTNPAQLPLIIFKNPLTLDDFQNFQTIRNILNKLNRQWKNKQFNQYDYHPSVYCEGICMANVFIKGGTSQPRYVDIMPVLKCALSIDSTPLISCKMTIGTNYTVTKHSLYCGFCSCFVCFLYLMIEKHAKCDQLHLQ